MANLIKINVDTKYTYGTILKFLIYIYSLQMKKMMMKKKKIMMKMMKKMMMQR